MSASQTNETFQGDADGQITSRFYRVNSEAFAPIFRYGSFVEARNEDGQRIVFTHDGMKKAINAVTSDAKKYFKEIVQFFEELGWKVSSSKKLTDLAPFRVKKRIGAVADFEELLLENDGNIFVLRPSITVCVDANETIQEDDSRVQLFKQHSVAVIREGNDRDAQNLEQKEILLYSKIWVRTACVKSRGVASANMSLEDYYNFAQHSRHLSMGLIEHLKSTYKDTLNNHMLGNIDEKIESINILHSLSCFMASSVNPEFDKRYRESVFHIMDWLNSDSDSHTGRFLWDMRKVFFRNTGGKYSFHRENDNLFAKSFHWKTRCDGETLLVGLAHDGLWEPEKNDGYGLKPLAFRGAPCNSMSAIITGQMASRV